MNDIDGADSAAADASLLDTRAAVILGNTALRPQAGRNDPRIGQGTMTYADFNRGISAPTSMASLCTRPFASRSAVAIGESALQVRGTPTHTA